MKIHVSKVETIDHIRLYQLDKITGMKVELDLPQKYLASVPHCYYESVAGVDGLTLKTEDESIYISMGCLISLERLKSLLEQIEECKMTLSMLRTEWKGTEVFEV